MKVFKSLNFSTTNYSSNVRYLIHDKPSRLFGKIILPHVTRDNDQTRNSFNLPTKKLTSLRPSSFLSLAFPSSFLRFAKYSAGYPR